MLTYADRSALVEANPAVADLLQRQDLLGGLQNMQVRALRTAYIIYMHVSLRPDALHMQDICWRCSAQGFMH